MEYQIHSFDCIYKNWITRFKLSVDYVFHFIITKLDAIWYLDENLLVDLFYLFSFMVGIYCDDKDILAIN